MAVFGPIPGIRLSDLTSSETILSLKLETDAFERRLIAVLGPIPDTSIKFKKRDPVSYTHLRAHET